MEVKQLVQQIILDIADEIVEVAKEESSGREGNSGVVRRLILPLLQSQSIPPVSTLFPSPASHILQPKVLKQKKNDSCGYDHIHTSYSSTSFIDFLVISHSCYYNIICYTKVKHYKQTSNLHTLNSTIYPTNIITQMMITK